jgi:hypothetical protein
MSRIPQGPGQKGSLRWIQRAVGERWPSLEMPVLARAGSGRAITWRSPLEEDEFAEYRDGAFLDLLGLSHLQQPLTDFWPDRGPQWDALAQLDGGGILLVEAKAHVGELCSPGSAAGAVSLARIAARLEEVAQALGASATRAPWTTHFYQLANRIAHLHFLRSNGVDAWLVLVNFLGDTDMRGPGTAEVWEAAYAIAWHVMGLGNRHPLSRYIVEVYPDVREQSAR